MATSAELSEFCRVVLHSSPSPCILHPLHVAAALINIAVVVVLWGRVAATT